MQTGQPQEIDYVSAGLGLSALNDAAKCGHAKCIEVFLDFNAAVDPRRKNGKTPMHENFLTLALALARALALALALALTRQDADARGGGRRLCGVRAVALYPYSTPNPNPDPN